MGRLVGGVVLLCVAFNGWGQSSVGSSYSIFGLGELQPKATIQSRGMGFTSIGMNSPYWANTVNPAANTNVGGYYTHIFDFGIYYNSTSYQTNEVEEQLADGGISHLSYWLRLGDKWTGTVGLSSFSKVGYDISAEEVTTSQGKIYDVNYIGSGGLNKVFLNQSYELVPNLSLGLGVSFLFGNLTHQEVATSEVLESFTVTNQINVSKVNLDFGLNYKIVKDSYAVNLGLIYDNGTDLTAQSSIKLEDPALEIVYEETESVEDYSLPQNVGLGVSFINEKFMIAADAEFNQWSKVNAGTDQRLNDTFRYAFGLEFTPNRGGLNYLSNVSYRGGYYIENSYLNIDNTDFNKWGITAGLGLPLKSNGALNIAYHRKVNGTTANNLILETTNEINLSVSIRSLWFTKRKYD